MALAPKCRASWASFCCVSSISRSTIAIPSSIFNTIPSTGSSRFPLPLSRPGITGREHRVLIRAAKFVQEFALVQRMFEQRIVVKHVHRARTRPHALLQVHHHPPHSRFSKRIEQKNNQRIRGKRECRRVRTDRFHREASLRLTLVLE